jgi:hypothetical protein
MAVAAIIAMLHDVLISVGVYSVFGFEVTPATVVAFLTILGFSLYDTIVVFDKVKENTERYSATACRTPTSINVSMNQVLMRSLNTSLAAVLPVLSLLVLGSGILGAVTLREFASPCSSVCSPARTRRSSSPRRCWRCSRSASRVPQPARPARHRVLELERLVLGGRPRGRRERGPPPAPERGPTDRGEGGEVVIRGPPPPRPCSRTRRGRARRSVADAPVPAGGTLACRPTPPGSPTSSATSPTTRTPGVTFRDITPLLGDGRRSASRSPSWRTASTTCRSTGCSAWRPVGSSSPRRSRTAWAPGSSRCARPASCRGRWSARSTQLEYGSDKLEIHRDAIHPGERILVIDDVLATGGTAAATCRLVEALGGVVVGLGFLIEIEALGGRAGWAAPGREPGQVLMATVDRVLPWRRHQNATAEELTPLLTAYRGGTRRRRWR